MRWSSWNGYERTSRVRYLEAVVSEVSINQERPTTKSRLRIETRDVQLYGLKIGFVLASFSSLSILTSP